MGFESSVWEASRPPLKPRLLADPQNDALSRRLGRFGGGAGGLGRDGARAKLARIVKGAPEVMVKVTGRQKGASHVQAHLDYISRKGKLALDTRDGEVLDTTEDVADRRKEWTEMTPYWRQKTTVCSVSMVFSMPEGTDPEIVKASVRAMAESEIADAHDYVMALHTDTPRPHVHLTVRARGDDGQRFDPRKADLFHFRERFAEELRARGVEAEATPRRARAIGPKGRSMALAKIRLRAKVSSGAISLSDIRLNQHAASVATGMAQMPEFIARAKERWSEISGNYRAAAIELAKSPESADRQLAAEVQAFLKDRSSISMGPELLAQRYREAAKITKEDDKNKPVIRPGPVRSRSR